jgi:ABC-type oligopeptide transport system substrate-binding subunit
MKKHLFGSLLTASALLLAACGEAATSSSIVSSSVSSSVSTSAPEVPLAGFANGEFNFKFAPEQLRNTLFGTAEKWLLDSGAGGVPLYANSTFVMFSDRMKLFSEASIPVMGFGTAISQLTGDDSTVTVEGVKGKVGEFTYRTAITSNPTSFNQWLTNDSVSSDVAAPLLASLYEFNFNASKTGYVVEGLMASADPIPVEPVTLPTGTVVAKKWQIPLRANMKWAFHKSVDPVAKGYDVNITADDFIDTYKISLDNGWYRAITGGSSFWSASNPIKGAEDYYKAIVAKTAADWDSVGIKKVVKEGVEHLEFEFLTDMSRWNVKYYLSSNVMSPVHKQMFEEFGKEYATTAEKTAFHGPFALDYYEVDKVIRMVKNPNFIFPNKYFYTGYNFQVIKDSIARFNSFLAGDLEVGAVTSTQYEQYRNDPRLRFVPGATTFRLNVNGLKTPEAQEALFPAAENGNWTPKPILGYPEMQKALYFGVDREYLAKSIIKTAEAQQFHFTPAYLVEAEGGVPFRNTPEAKLFVTGLSIETNGFNKAAATSFFKAAVNKAVADGFVQRGVANNPTVLELQVIIPANTDSQLAAFLYLKEAYEATFVDDVNNVRVLLNPLFAAFPDNYYAHILIGQSDLGFGGIAGGTLDAAGFFDIYTSDNRGGFTMNWGFDTSLAEIDVTYTVAGVTKTEKWSFDALQAALNGPVTVLNGREVK